MTAQGVMSSPTPAMNFSGFSFSDVPVKETKGSSFQEFMAASKDGNAQKSAEDLRKTGQGTANTATSLDSARERAKELFSGESKVKEADAAQTGESVKDFEEAAEAVASLMVQVRQVICEQLEITDEQLTVTMEELGLTDADLLDRNSLQELFLKLNNASEPTEFLTNEELFDGFADLMQAVEQTLYEAGIMPEECKAILKEAELLPQDADEEYLTEEPEILLRTEEPEEEQSDDAKEVQPDVSMEGADKKVASQTETRAETGNTKDGEHTVKAKEERTGKVISSETDTNVRNVFLDTLTNYAAAETGEKTLEAAARIREIADQIMEQIKIVIRPEQTNMELQLNPEHLGRVHLTITEKEGMMTAQFTAQSEVAKEAIESQMAVLRESLQNQGIKVEAIEVTVSEFGFERDRDAKQNEDGESGKQKRRQSFRVEEAEEAVPQMADFINTTESSVDYSA
ncbi:MAG: flagellar hook-length control protein FliK [Lachnospiraceae bacterium]|nr:flagellar hook-length control protein FliK [Lachnospiraceae bacterium]